MPAWANQLFDANVSARACQRINDSFFQLASSGNYNQFGRLFTEPANGGIFIINNSEGQSYATVAKAITAQTNGKFYYGKRVDSVTHFDNWTIHIFICT
jgi:hypothetical protein